MTITLDARSGAPTAAGPPTSSHSSDDASQAAIISPYGMMPVTPTGPDDVQTGPQDDPRTRGAEPSASSADKPHPPRRRLAPAPIRARVVAGVIDLAVGSLLTGGLTTLIWQVGGRPVLTSGLIAFGVVVALRWFAIAATGWSLGGLLLKVRMLGARNQAPSPLGSFIHADLILAISVTTLGLGTIALMRTAAADPEGRGWHDKLSGMALLRTRAANRPDRGAAPTSESAAGALTGSKAGPASGSQSGPASDDARDAAERAALYIKPTEKAAGAEPTQQSSPETGSEGDPRPRRRRSEKADRRADKRAGRASKRTSRTASARTRKAADSTTATVGAQSATEAGIVASRGGTAHPTTSDPVSSSIRRPRPARPGQPARHAGRAMAAGSHDDSSAASRGKISADGYGVIQAPRTTGTISRTTARATKAATVSSSSAASASSASPAVSDVDAAAVAVASATPMDPQASAALAATEASAMSAEQRQSTRSAQSAPSTDRSAGGAAPSAVSAAAPAQNAAEESATTRTATGTQTPVKPAGAPSESDRLSSKQSSQMDAETATLEAVEDAPEHSDALDKAEAPSTRAPSSSRHPAVHQSPEATTPSAESSKTATDSETYQASTSQDTTPSTQVPRSKATKAVTSQTMEPRHAHAQRWRIQPGSSGKKSSGSSAAPAEDQREPASQPGVPRRESLFTSERHRFASGASSAPEVAHTFDTSSILPSEDRNTQALIDSVPWSSVPTSVDAATVDSLPEGVIVSDDDSPLQASPASSQLDLTDPATVPGGVPATSAGNAHPTVRSHRSHAQTSGASGSAGPAASEGTPSRRTHASHRFQGPGIPEPAEERTAHSDSRNGESAAQAPASRRESRTPATPEHAWPSPTAASASGRGAARTGHSAGSAGAAAPAEAPASRTSVPTPVPAASAQTATPSLPSASSAAPALSVRLVPLLGGNPILIHEPTVVGRDPDNISAYPGAERVALDDPTRSVSKTHAAIFPLLDGVWVTDLHSTNGTRVEYRDGRNVEAVPDKALSALEGSTIYFGRIAFKVEVV